VFLLECAIPIPLVDPWRCHKLLDRHTYEKLTRIDLRLARADEQCFAEQAAAMIL